MNILFIIMHLKKGGAELMLSRLANSLSNTKTNCITVVSLMKFNKDDVSVYTSKFFDSYSHEILE